MAGAQTFPSMLMVAADQRDIIKKNFGPAFVSNNITTKILVLDHNWDLTDYVLTVLGDPTTNSYVAGVAWHCYKGIPSAQSTIHNAYPDKDAFFTECSPGDKPVDFGGKLIFALDTLYVDSVNNWARGVIHWNIALDPNNGPHVQGGCPVCRGLLTIYSNGTYSKEPEYYSMAHNSKFVDIGAYRISSMSSSDSISVVSYLNPNGSYVAIVLNKSLSNRQFDLNWKDQYLTYSLPQQSVVTFTWSPLAN